MPGPHRAELCRVVPCYAVLCRAMLCRAAPLSARAPAALLSPPHSSVRPPRRAMQRIPSLGAGHGPDPAARPHPAPSQPPQPLSIPVSVRTLLPAALHVFPHGFAPLPLSAPCFVFMTVAGLQNPFAPRSPSPPRAHAALTAETHSRSCRRSMGVPSPCARMCLWLPARGASYQPHEHPWVPNGTEQQLTGSGMETFCTSLLFLCPQSSTASSLPSLAVEVCKGEGVSFDG